MHANISPEQMWIISVLNNAIVAALGKLWIIKIAIAVLSFYTLTKIEKDAYTPIVANVMYVYNWT